MAGEVGQISWGLGRSACGARLGNEMVGEEPGLYWGGAGRGGAVNGAVNSVACRC